MSPIILCYACANSPCQLLETNMRLKLGGPDYEGKDPVASLEDFKKRVAAYESAYEPLGKFEEDSHMQYIQVSCNSMDLINLFPFH